MARGKLLFITLARQVTTTTTIVSKESIVVRTVMPAKYQNAVGVHLVIGLGKKPVFAIPTQK